MIVDLFCIPRQFGADVSLQLDMGAIIYLDEWRADHLRSSADAPPAFFFDLGCPLSYLSAERVERNLGKAEWIPVPAAMVHAGQPGRSSGAHADADDLREFAEAQARLLRLPLIWPDRLPGPQAQRAAAYAVAIGAGPQFALAASRLAFCGGFDLSDPEILAEAAAASAVPLATLPARGRRPGLGRAARGHGAQPAPARHP